MIFLSVALVMLVLCAFAITAIYLGGLGLASLLGFLREKFQHWRLRRKTDAALERVEKTWGTPEGTFHVWNCTTYNYSTSEREKKHSKAETKYWEQVDKEIDAMIRGQM
jgi:hypothetical protein